MKNVLGFIGYTILTITGLTYIGNKIADLFMAKDNSEPPIRHVKKKTVYPDNEPDDFNEWTQYIHDENYLNHRN